MMLDVETFPGQVPYRAILPQGVDNLLVPVCLSSTHVAWGTIRLEPTWMSLCESAGHAAAMAVQQRIAPAQIDSDALQRKLAASHVMLSFFNDVDVASNDSRVAPAQYFATKGFFADYDAKLDDPLTEAVKTVWQQSFDDPQKRAEAVAKAETASSTPTGQTRGEVLWAMFESLMKH